MVTSFHQSLIGDDTTSVLCIAASLAGAELLLGINDLSRGDDEPVVFGEFRDWQLPGVMPPPPPDTSRIKAVHHEER